MYKKWMYPAGFVIAALIGFYMYQKYHVAPALNLNSLSLADLDGNPVRMESFKGKKLVVCFSASWCGNCREELDAITSVKEREIPEVEVVVISDEPLEKVRTFKNKSGYPFTFLKMNKPFNSIGIYSIPTSYIVNERLEVVKETVGYINWKDPSMLQHIKMIME
jgi:peroxiredoxin